MFKKNSYKLKLYVNFFFKDVKLYEIKILVFVL